jgi:two-component system sensor histidine kinase KdpD
MKRGERRLVLEVKKVPDWVQYLLDSLLATVGSLLVTLIIVLFHLYPRIPNISIIYLLVVLALASTRGRYAAIFASLVAFFTFDFFVVPPLYTFTIARPEEWIALFVFLLDAILTGHLASALRQRAQEAARRERETYTLYDLMRVTTREEEPMHQLQAIAQAIVDVFSSWGVHDCAILQLNHHGNIQVEANAYEPAEHITLSRDEQAIALWVMTHGRSMEFYDDDVLPHVTSPHFVQRVFIHRTATGHAVRRSLHLLPLKMGQKVVGVLRLRVFDGSRQLKQIECQEEDRDHPSVPATFFWTFLDQVASLIERVRLQRENMRVEVLQRTDALRTALLSSVSHDLRTPLTVIKAAASSLLQEDVDWDEEAQRSFALSIEREADRLNRLVGNLLDMSRIEDGALKPQKDWYQVKALIQDVLDRLQPLLQGRNISLYFPTDLPPIELDYLQIDQVLTNLIENAVRYTPSGSPIDVSAQQSGNEIIIQVADRGPGIPENDYERIFDKFYRVLNTKNRHPANPSGSGLGLAVCKGLVEAHGGKIWAEPRPEGGTTFFVVFPVGTLEGSVA